MSEEDIHACFIALGFSITGDVTLYSLPAVLFPKVCVCVRVCVLSTSIK